MAWNSSCLPPDTFICKKHCINLVISKVFFEITFIIYATNTKKNNLIQNALSTKNLKQMSVKNIVYEGKHIDYMWYILP